MKYEHCQNVKYLVDLWYHVEIFYSFSLELLHFAVITSLLAGPVIFTMKISTCTHMDVLSLRFIYFSKALFNNHNQ